MEKNVIKNRIDMKSSLTQFHLLICSTVILYHVRSTHQYRQLYIESDSLCSEITKRKIRLDKEYNSALIVKQTRLNDHRLDWETNKFCKFQVNSPYTQSGGILAVIQYLNFRRDPVTDECLDYVQFKPKDGSLSRKFCGLINATVLMHHRQTVPQSPLIYENSGIDYRGELDVYINISKKALLSTENADLSIVFTSYKHCSRNHLNDALQPCSDTIRTFCIFSGFFNDGIVNCPYADCTDENGCIKTANTQSIGSKVLISSISALFVLFIVFVLLIWACKKHKILCWSVEFSNATPTPQMEGTSQSRTIEMNEQTGARLATQQVRAPSMDEGDKDLPPSYDSLFPESR